MIDLDFFDEKTTGMGIHKRCYVLFRYLLWSATSRYCGIPYTRLHGGGQCATSWSNSYPFVTCVKKPAYDGNDSSWKILLGFWFVLFVFWNLFKKVLFPFVFVFLCLKIFWCRHFLLAHFIPSINNLYNVHRMYLFILFSNSFLTPSEFQLLQKFESLPKDV